MEIIDQYNDDKGGYAMLLHGGVDYEDVTIYFESQRNYGFNFTVLIYAHP